MGYENAPATKMLATHCAACGRALVDAVSVEMHMGPECRAKYALPDCAADDARTEANKIVWELARGGLTRDDARPMFLRLEELGFVLLAERVALRFRTKLADEKPSMTACDPEAQYLEEKRAADERDELRAEYADLLRGATYGNGIDAAAFNARVRAELAKKNITAPMPADFVACAKAVRCPCRRCAGTGHYIAGGIDRGGACFRCEGKGYQTAADGHRNRVYDERGRPAPRAA